MHVWLRRSERIGFRRPMALVYHNELGHALRVPVQADSVSCHGLGLRVDRDCPVGAPVYLLDASAGVGVWGRVVWQRPGDSEEWMRIGLEFACPGNYWKQRLIPPDWMAHLPPRPRAQHVSSRPRRLRLRRVRVRMKLPAPVRTALYFFQRLRRRYWNCRCCGNEKQLVFAPAQREIVCRTCFNWAV